MQPFLFSVILISCTGIGVLIRCLTYKKVFAQLLTSQEPETKEMLHEQLFTACDILNGFRESFFSAEEKPVAEAAANALYKATVRRNLFFKVWIVSLALEMLAVSLMFGIVVGVGARGFEALFRELPNDEIIPILATYIILVNGAPVALARSVDVWMNCIEEINLRLYVSHLVMTRVPTIQIISILLPLPSPDAPENLWVDEPSGP